ncbi:MAG TPA: TauD/TfdA family dioxygenase [Amycolatopsis sp.]|nr:TauD/TfdA family dioxygenase [Amycolatopsis sp.]
MTARPPSGSPRRPAPAGEGVVALLLRRGRLGSPPARRVVGIDRDESDRLLRYLFSRAHVPEFQVRFAWRPGSVAFWDNRATQHYAVNDYHPYARVAERVAIVGDRPF